MEHFVFVTLPEREIDNSDVSFVVKKGKNVFGTLRVSKGGVNWKPALKHSAIHKTWAQLHALFETSKTTASLKKVAPKKRKPSTKASAAASKKITSPARTAAAKKSAVVKKAPAAQKTARTRKAA